MQNRPFLSVVMPIYNVEEYLRTAIQSVLSQSFFDIEIILVDDCSPDNSAKICAEYVENYDFITYIKHEHNMGLSAARNSGIEASRGKYIWFMDPDDCLEGELFQKVFDEVFARDYEVVIFGLKEKYYNKSGELTKTVEIKPQSEFITDTETLGKRIIELEKASLYGYAWNKFYLLDVIKQNNLRYEDIPLIEDIKFNVLYFDNIKSAALLGISPYSYAKRENQSITSKFVPRYFEVHYDRVRLILEQTKRFGVCDENAQRILANIFVRYIFSAISRNCDSRSNMNRKQRKAWLEGLFEDELFKTLIPKACAESAVLKIMTALLQKQRTSLCLLLGRVIYFTQGNIKSVFIKLKQKRA